MSSYVWGVDVGATTIKLLSHDHGRDNRGKLSYLRWKIVLLPQLKGIARRPHAFP